MNALKYLVVSQFVFMRQEWSAVRGVAVGDIGVGSRRVAHYVRATRGGCDAVRSSFDSKSVVRQMNHSALVGTP